VDVDFKSRIKRAITAFEVVDVRVAEFPRSSFTDIAQRNAARGALKKELKNVRRLNETAHWSEADESRERLDAAYAALRENAFTFIIVRKSVSIKPVRGDIEALELSRRETSEEIEAEYVSLTMNPDASYVFVGKTFHESGAGVATRRRTVTYTLTFGRDGEVQSLNIHDTDWK